ncbi:hypothetical protein DSO57_1031918 [Entomophthora muscae]|uniref:Uncharacterized protein n=1 Tax=Entomophthora muscae TaxID=34485 RepID=A0ACC2TMX3_9FUNG|nr:hypothetical protein DSO57_1031918 [Entomophthora muscae]
MSKNNQNKYNGKESTPSPRKKLEIPVSPPLPPISERLANHGLRRHATRKDGNCLFRALSHHLEGHEKRHL